MSLLLLKRGKDFSGGMSFQKKGRVLSDSAHGPAYPENFNLIL
jgi:hypothetical protein